MNFLYLFSFLLHKDQYFPRGLKFGVGYPPPFAHVWLQYCSTFESRSYSDGQFYRDIDYYFFFLCHLLGQILPQSEKKQVSSMIHSARPTVTPVENIVFHCFVLLDLKSGDGRTRRTTCAKTMIPTGRDCELAVWINYELLAKPTIGYNLTICEIGSEVFANSTVSERP